LISDPGGSIIDASMSLSLAAAWKLAFALALVATVFASACVRAPRQSVPGSQLRQLVLSALGLYAVGGLASLTHHEMLAGLVYGAGITVAALAAWLSRGRDQEDPPDGGEPVDSRPPPEPEGLDWDRFERSFRDYSERMREPAGRG
jgi:hypothetical protein